MEVGVTYSSPGSSTANGAATRPASLVAYSIVSERARSGSLAGWCALPGNALGVEYHIVGTAPNGQVVADYRVCVPIQPAGDAANFALPRPPTLEETWRAARLPAPTVLTDPAARGITGLDTRIWTTGAHTASIAAAVRGYRIVGTATLDHYTISVDGGPVQDAGSGHYTFETKGRHTIAIGAVWHATATLTGPDLIAPVVLPDIGTATITTTRTYPVHEVRAVLQP
ncbi:MAG TPA: hypothetical protein VEZ15_13250 [Acidimicrobiia bacterium]|nr:hypothetical protein [Acidimicrobiia bacterium]